MKTNVNLSLSLSLSLSLFILPHIVTSFNITQILDQYPDFSTYNTYLTQANLVAQINSRQTITVLVVDNSNMSPLSGKPPQVISNVLSVHVILDYFDVPKLQMLPEAPTTLTTLFQASGQARGQQGFLNVTHAGSEGISFGSPVAGSPPGSNLVRSVFTQPYNISVLQVSKVILPPRAEAPARGAQPPAASPPTPPTPTPTKAPSASPSVSQAEPSMSPNMSPPSPVSPIPSPPTPSVASTPSKPPLPSAEAPTAAVNPPSATPASSPGLGAYAPAVEAPAAVGETPLPSHSKLPADADAAAGTTHGVGLAVVYTVAAAAVFLAMRV